MDKSKLSRINELARKSRESELTADEKAEQHALREEYLMEFRSNLKNTLDNVTVVDKEGNVLIKSKNNKNLS